MPLSDARVRALRPRQTAYKAYDERGLYVYVATTGSRLWRLKVRVNGREQLLSFGPYPEISLAEARRRRDEALAIAKAGHDPRAPARELARSGTFEQVAEKWLEAVGETREWDANTLTQVRCQLERHVYPKIGAMKIAAVRPTHIRPLLQGLDRFKKRTTAHRVRSHVCRVMRFAIGQGWAEIDPTEALRDTLMPLKTEHFASVTDATSIGRLLVATRGYQGSPAVRAALNLAPLVFVRPGELRSAHWAHVDLAGAEWRIPGSLMKMGIPHTVPLSRQAIAILEELRPYTRKSKFVFPNLRDREKPMSENAVNAALRSIGYQNDEMTGHGYRSMASTVLNEMAAEYGWSADAIERQLAHVEPNKVRAAYNYAEYLPQRREIMQHWADYLDQLADAASRGDDAADEDSTSERIQA